MPALGGCLEKGAQIKLNRSVLRGSAKVQLLLASPCTCGSPAANSYLTALDPNE